MQSFRAFLQLFFLFYWDYPNPWIDSSSLVSNIFNDYYCVYHHNQLNRDQPIAPFTILSTNFLIFPEIRNLMQYFIVFQIKIRISKNPLKAPPPHAPLSSYSRSNWGGIVSMSLISFWKALAIRMRIRIEMSAQCSVLSAQ